MSGHKTIIKYETQSGVMLHIIPLSLATLRAIMLKAEEVLPYPPKKDYEKPLENTFVEGMMDSAENNPEYIQACMAVDRERNQWRDKAVFMYAVRFPDFPDIGALVQAFAPQLLELRKIALVPDDNFDAILHHIILTWNEPARDKSGALAAQDTEYAKIIRMAIQTIALTPDEVTEGVRFFRPDVPENRARKMAG